MTVFRPRVLIVESVTDLSLLVSSTLHLMGTDFCLVVSQDEACVRIDNEKFDGVLIDWDNPQLDPERFIRSVRSSKSNHNIPIAILSGRAEVSQLAKGLQSGATFFLAKPFGEAELVSLLNATRGMMAEERRRYQRVPLRVPALCQWGLKRRGKSAMGRTVNISSSGVLMKLASRPETGTAVQMELRLPGERSALHLKGLVVRSGPAEQVGVQFVRVGEQERKLIETFVATHPGTPLFPGG